MNRMCQKVFAFLLFAAAVTLALPQRAQPPGAFAADMVAEPLSFHIHEGNNENYFLSTPAVACHLIITGEANPRLLVNFPAGNSGIALWCDRKNPVNGRLSMKLAGKLEPLEGKKGSLSSGVRFRVDTGQNKVVITHFMLDSIRQIRNYGTSETKDVAETREKLSRSSLSLLPVVKINRGEVEIRRATLKGGNYRLTIVPDRGTTITPGKEGLLSLESSHPLSLRVECAVPFTPLAPYERSGLFSRQALLFREELCSKVAQPGASPAERVNYERFGEALRNLQFLSYREKYCAGSWRFLTYFGRDTLLSLMMLQPVITPTAYSDGMMSVFERLSPEGAVAHEEDIGSWAEYRHGRAFLQGVTMPVNPEDPLYDYKMVDSDFLLPLMACRYLCDDAIPAAERKAFLERVNSGGEKNLVALLRNGDYVLRQAEPYVKSFFESSRYSYRPMVRIKEGEGVGNWRDSLDGLGGGVYPADVNMELVPRSLESLDRIVRASLYNREELMQEAEKAHLARIASMLGRDREVKLREWSQIWKSSREFFRVSLSPQEVRTRVKAYLERGVSDGERRYFLHMPVDEGISIQDFVYGDRIPSVLSRGLSFDALSLNGDGSPVEVENSDCVFTLFLDEPDPQEVTRLLQVLALPYPLGLYTDVGVLVANPAFSCSEEHWKKLDRKAYHGTVIWSWQIYMLELGLVRQIERFSAMGGQAELVAKMKKTLLCIQKARERAGALANSELWSFIIEKGTMLPAAFGSEEGTSDESNAVQLWSTVFPAVMMKEYRLEGK
jgi:hypothetical protein